MHISYTLTIKSMTILLKKQKNIKCSTVETHHFSLGIPSQNKKINEIMTVKPFLPHTGLNGLQTVHSSSF